MTKPPDPNDAGPGFPEPNVPKEALARYLDFILQPASSSLLPINTVAQMLEPLGIACRVVCRARMVASEAPFLVVVTSDPDPLLSVHDRRRDPDKGRTLEDRRQTGADTWEYDVGPSDEDTLTGEFALRLSWSARHQDVLIYPPIETLARAVGWGNEIIGVVADAAVVPGDVAWAVTYLLTGQERPVPALPWHYERFRAATVLAEYYGVSRLP